MAREIELAAVTALEAVCGPSQPTPAWLMRPGREECRDRWSLVREIYRYLTSQGLPESMPPRERRMVDGVFEYGGRPFVFELDESQHFNVFRATTLRCYPEDLPLAFDRSGWLARCARKARLEGGGFAKPRPPLFDGENGRHRQRAFRDALADIVPPEHGFLPTVRIGDWEIGAWITDPDAQDRMRQLLAQRLSQIQQSSDGSEGAGDMLA